mmetsp:Transcript_17670/g.28612  ORF Transcript_17670/g.28612 Transcript_17670/m.28612 type:complete len:191 (-) Transcript_17670:144-716(-)
MPTAQLHCSCCMHREHFLDLDATKCLLDFLCSQQQHQTRYRHDFGNIFTLSNLSGLLAFLSLLLPQADDPRLYGDKKNHPGTAANPNSAINFRRKRKKKGRRREGNCSRSRPKNMTYDSCKWVTPDLELERGRFELQSQFGDKLCLVVDADSSTPLQLLHAQRALFLDLDTKKCLLDFLWSQHQHQIRHI